MPQVGSEFTVESLEAVPAVQLQRFDRDDAFVLGSIAVELMQEQDLDVEVDVHIGEELAFRAQRGTTGQSNADVIERKRMAAVHFRESSLLARLRKDLDPSVADGLDERYHLAGGSVPIFIDGEVAATVSASGLPHTEDHRFASEALQRFVARSRITATGHAYYPRYVVSLEVARALADHAVATGAARGLVVTASVVDPALGLVAFARPHSAPADAERVSRAKASTAAGGVASGSLPDHVVRSLAQVSPEVITDLKGGLPIRFGGRLVGGLGVTGGKPEEDVEIARTALAAVGADTEA